MQLRRHAWFLELNLSWPLHNTVESELCGVEGKKTKQTKDYVTWHLQVHRLSVQSMYRPQWEALPLGWAYPGQYTGPAGQSSLGKHMNGN